MSKKQMNKKKVNVKLVSGQSVIVLDYDTLMHIAESYDFLGREKNDEYSQWYFDVADEVRRQTLDNYFGESDGYEEDYEW